MIAPLRNQSSPIGCDEAVEYNKSKQIPPDSGAFKDGSKNYLDCETVSVSNKESFIRSQSVAKLIFVRILPLVTLDVSVLK